VPGTPTQTTLSQIVKFTHGKPSTLKLRLRELVEKGCRRDRGTERIMGGDNEDLHIFRDRFTPTAHLRRISIPCEEVFEVRIVNGCTVALCQPHALTSGNIPRGRVMLR
jgi:hypothetical protein